MLDILKTYTDPNLWESMRRGRSEDKQRELAAAYASQADYLCLTDCHLNRGAGGAIVLQQAEAMSDGAARNLTAGFADIHDPLTWKLRCVVLPNGEAPKPGDVITWKRQHMTELPGGRRLTNEIRRDMVLQGMIPDSFGRAKLDDDCCLTLKYSDAMYLLTQFGRHYSSKRGICGRAEKMKHTCNYSRTGDPQDAKNGLVHNWQFEEVVPGFNEPETKTRRGRKASSNVTEDGPSA